MTTLPRALPCSRPEGLGHLYRGSRAAAGSPLGGDADHLARQLGPGLTRYLDATLARLRDGGFSIEGALDACSALDSHLYGVTLQELNLPFEVEESSAVSASVLPQSPADQFPHVVEVIEHVVSHGRREDFLFGLDLILDGLERTLAGE